MDTLYYFIGWKNFWMSLLEMMCSPPIIEMLIQCFMVLHLILLALVLHKFIVIFISDEDEIDPTKEAT